MKALIILAVLISASAFAGDKPYMQFGDIKGEVTEKAKDESEATAIDNTEKHRPETGKRQHKPLTIDTDDDGDSVPTRACNAKDNDCDDQVKAKKE